MLAKILRTSAVLLAMAMVSAGAEEKKALGLGDYGYRHHDFHTGPDGGVVGALRRKTGRSCCDQMGECRATRINIQKRTALLDGKECPLGNVEIRTDIDLPGGDDVVCASKTSGTSCPKVYCAAVDSRS